MIRLPSFSIAITIARQWILICCAIATLGCEPSQSNSSALSAKVVAAESVPPSTVTENYLSRNVRDDIFYFVMPDRFYNGNVSNDLGSKTLPISSGGFDPSSRSSYHGGDLQGLRQKLPYLQDLGVTAIWMTPILRNQAVQGPYTGYHGYWTIDYYQVDPHFGTNDELKALIDDAHSRDMKVFFDIIPNHSADVIKYKECHQDDGNFLPGVNDCPYKSLAEVAKSGTYTPFVPAHKQGVKNPQWMNDTRFYHNQGETTYQGENAVYGDFAGLDDFDTDNPIVVDGMIEVFKNLITEFKPDGFRIDTVKHVNIDFWREFVPPVMAHARQQGIPQFHMFGEVYGADPVLLSRYTTIGQLPSVLDFGLQSALYDVYAKGLGTEKLITTFAEDFRYNDHDSDSTELMTFVDNHDMGRMGLFLNRERPNASDQEKLARLAQSHAVLFFARGIPVIYYGDEQGFTGDGNDHDAREDMMASEVASFNDNDLIGTDMTTADDNFDPEHPMYRALQSMASVYKAHKALRSGLQYPRYASPDPGIFAFSRILPDERQEYLVVFNTANETKQVELDKSQEHYIEIVSAQHVNQTAERLSLTLAPLSYAIFRTEKPIGKAQSVDFTLTSNAMAMKNKKVALVWDKIELSQQFVDPQLLALRRVTVAMSVDGSAFKTVAIQANPPYRNHIAIRDLPSGSEITLRVTADNFAGLGATQLLKLKVDKRAAKARADNEIYY